MCVIILWLANKPRASTPLKPFFAGAYVWVGTGDRVRLLAVPLRNGIVFCTSLSGDKSSWSVRRVTAEG
eukprot:2644648-Prymnesium_polylepis.1